MVAHSKFLDLAVCDKGILILILFLALALAIDR